MSVPWLRISVDPITHFGQIDHPLPAFFASSLFLPLLIGLYPLSHRLALQFDPVTKYSSLSSSASATVGLLTI